MKVMKPTMASNGCKKSKLGFQMKKPIEIGIMFPVVPPPYSPLISPLDKLSPC
jgi:hypothetical protein